MCGRLAVRVCVSCLRDDVEGVLVFVTVIAPHLHADLVESVCKERRLHDETCQADVAGRLQIDLVERSGEIIRAVARSELAEGLGVGDSRLSLGAEAAYRVANLLCLRQAHP